MYAVERLSSYISRGVYTVSAPFHPFGGAVDIIVVQQQDGSFKSSPWYVKFGKFQGVLKEKEKIVNISVNGAEANFHMYMDHKGEGYFLTEVDGEEGDAVVSLSSGEEIDKKSQSGKLVKAQSLVIDDKKSQSGKLVKTQSLVSDDKKTHSLTQTDRGNRRKLTRTKSRRFRILGLMFGRKSLKEGGSSRKREPIMERVSSLERAEIAADLLEVKWSTNLKADHKRKDKSVPGPSDTRVLQGDDKDTGQLVEEVDKDTQVNKNKANLGSPFADDILDCCAPGPIHQQKNELMNASIGEAEDFDKITGLGSVSRVHEQVLDGSTLESIVAPVKHEMHFKQLTRENDEVNVENEPVFEAESGREISSYVYFETKESSSVESEDFDEQSHGTPESGCKEVELPTEIRISKVNSPLEYGQFTSVEILGGSDNLESSVTNSIEPEIMEVIHQSTVVQRLFPDKNLETDLKRHFQNQSDCQLTKISSTNLFSNENRLARMESLTKPDFIVVEEMLHSIKEAESRAICTLSGLGDLSGLVQEIQNLREVVEIQEHQISPEVTTSPHEGNVIASTEKAAKQDLISCFSLGGNKFLSSAVDSVVAGGTHNEETNDHPAECMVEAELRLSNLNHTSAFSPCHRSFQSPLSRALISYPGELNQESFPRENLPEEPSTPATATCIPRSGPRAGEVGQCKMPFPIIPDHIDNLQTSDDKPSQSRPLDLTLSSLSRSLGLAYENSKFEMVAKDLSAYLKLFALESDLTLVRSTSEGVHATDCGQGSQDDELTSTNCPAEISLCRHLLFKGMGAEAASQAFDSEKLNLEKFNSIGPSIVKSDRLVMRFNGHYFHSESSAPTILGMISFDQEHMSEPEGTTVVDQVQRPLDGESVPAGGTWRPWPFKFAKPKSTSFPPNCNSNKVIDGENLVATDNTSKTKAPKKKIWSNVPTSDQLASLNLKEGQNVITFTFSTAMLGGQQVDARIYLWKWSTRVVLSDVDGTITKSDVLGQFMPLVGKDWSQTGVAHLFSAIKENGYQLLFLSARAISQAYLTRQFLANLKQDGKVLPDGPLLISPDGLFPSLYREVIRRAPHEFKIACLEDIRALFPPERNPFYAGFGNRETDEISYLKAGIPRGKIFTINSKGEVAVNRLVNTKSYNSIHSLVNDMFPAKAAEQEVFNSWNYWKLPLPAIKI